MANSIQHGTKLRPGAMYRITEVSSGDLSPTMHAGDVVHCEPRKRRALDPEPDGMLWFADYQGDGEGYGTLVSGLEEVQSLESSRIVPWKDGDARTHCTHCMCCGYLFRTLELDRHLAEAHLGGHEQEQKHLREAARLLDLCVWLDDDGSPPDEDTLEQYSIDLAAWLSADAKRSKEVRGG
jgi:hypothetical protein